MGLLLWDQIEPIDYRSLPNVFAVHDANRVDSYGLADATHLNQFRDLTGNSLLEQSTSTRWPLAFQQSLNGRQLIEFENLDCFNPNGTMNVSNGITVACVCQNTIMDSQFRSIVNQWNIGANQKCFLIGKDNNDELYCSWSSNGSATDGVVTSGISDMDPHIIIFSHDGTTGYLDVDGVNKGSSNVGLFQSTSGYAIGRITDAGNATWIGYGGYWIALETYLDFTTRTNLFYRPLASWFNL